MMQNVQKLRTIGRTAPRQAPGMLPAPRRPISRGHRLTHRPNEHTTSPQTIRLIDAGVSVMHAANAILRIDNPGDSMARRLRIHTKLAARKIDQTLGREAAAVMATCLALSHLLDAIGVYIDVKTLKPVLSTQMQTVVDLVHGKGDVDLSPLLVAILSRMGEPAAKRLIHSVRSRLMCPDRRDDM